MDTVTKKIECECSDAGCPVHKGQANCQRVKTMTLYRCDMEDRGGTFFCEACGQDAVESGLY